MSVGTSLLCAIIMFHLHALVKSLCLCNAAGLFAYAVPAKPRAMLGVHYTDFTSVHMFLESFHRYRVNVVSVSAHSLI